MSAHAGIRYFDGRPVRPDTIATLAATLEPYGPDGGTNASPAPGLALFSRRLCVTAEDRADVQPVALSNGAWLTWDGRLDNRADLMMELGMRPTPDVIDARIAARAVDSWGEDDTWRHLVGDWSAAVCDPGSGAVTLAVDFMGVRPLYYVITESYCAWSTALEGLVALTGRREDLNDVFFLCSMMRCRMPGHTPYRGIEAVVSGHRVRIDSAGAANIRQYWHLPESTIQYRDVRDYQVHLRTVFREAVRRRLRASGPVWMELSGGWDSSAIVCMAARLAEEGAVVTPGLTTTSYVSPADPESDETRFITPVEEQVNLPSMHIALDRKSMPVVPNPIHFCTTAPESLALYERMRERGARVLMSGRLGDGVFGNFPIDLTDAAAALRSWRLGRALGELRGWSVGTHQTVWSLLGDTLTELLPGRWIERRDAMEAVASIGRSASILPLPVEDVLCVPHDAMSYFFEVRALHTRWRLREQRPWTSRHFVGSVGLYALNLELSSPVDAGEIGVTYPLADRNLVEYVASIPARLSCEPGRPRALMRDAIGPMLPERTRRRFSKGNAAPFRTRLAQQHAPTLLARLDSLQVVTRSYIDRDRFRTQLHHALAGAPHTGGLLLRALLIEQWLSALPSNNSAAA
jgi:asparagine synthase (glutamine-hydrolysing)